MKMNKFARSIAFILALCLILSIVPPITVSAANTDAYDAFLTDLKVLEGYAKSYAAANPGKDANLLVINYIRTGVDKYTTSSWVTMAGPEETAFVNYVAEQDRLHGTTAGDLRDLTQFTTPNGQLVEFEHMFGAMNMAYYNANNADLGSWAGDLSDLLFYAKQGGAGKNANLNAMIADVRENYLGIDEDGVSGFGILDIYGDLDSYYLINAINAGGVLSKVIKAYYSKNLTDSDRAAYFLNNRFAGVLTKEDVRNAIYNSYCSNIGVQMLDAENGITEADAELKKACCYAFADYLFELAEGRLSGSQGGNVSNKYYSVISSNTTTLAPGITQTIQYAETADGKQIAYYIASVNMNRDDVSIHANYNNNDPTDGWAMSRVEDQMIAAQNRHNNPNDPEHYVENYNVIVGVNADFFNMSTGKPSGALVMEGVQYNGVGSENFFAILKDGTPVIGAPSEWAAYSGQVAEAVGGSSFLIKNGKIVATAGSNYTGDRASRTCVGITADNQVILMVLDGRQEPFSAGGSMIEIAQIMLDAGCVTAINLDGGGSSTFVAKPEGSDELAVVNRPSDGYQRSVSSSLVVVSTAVVSNEFSYANVSTEYDYLTVGTRLHLDAIGVSVSGNAAEIPGNAVWQLSDNTMGTLVNGDFIAAKLGDVTVELAVDGVVVGSKTLHVVVPDALSIGQTTMNVIYDTPTELPLHASFEGNPVAFNANDVMVVLQYGNAGTIEGLYFTIEEASEYRSLMVGAALVTNFSVNAMVTVNLYREDEAIFDFDNATSGNEQFAWLRDVLNAETKDGILYQIANVDENMKIDYVFALNMEAIPIPEQLEDLTYMLPGSDLTDASAWGFLLQLAERVSTLTEVVVTAQFDMNLEIDISEMTFANDFFTLSNVVLDEETNTLTITANWIDQTQAVDPATANPICILSGLKATPKDGASWDSKNQLAIVNTGDITYDIYLRASQLYSFSNIPGNQEQYGLYPFINPNDPSEKGGHFASTYATFEDTFILDKSSREGWYTEDNSLYYYANNQKLTGIHRVPSQENPTTKLYYSFDENGVCTGLVSGLFDMNGGKYYAVRGELRTGWQALVAADGSVKDYYFVPSTGAAVDGVQTIDGFTYTFTDYVLTRGQLVTNSTGTRYRWAGQWATQEWLELDGRIAYAQASGYFMTGLWKRFYTDDKVYYFAFGEDGYWMQEYSGLYEYEGATYLIEKGIVVEYAGLVKVGDDYYYFTSKNTMIKDCTYWLSKPNGIVPAGNYTFDKDGKMVMKPGMDPSEPDKPNVPTPGNPDVPALNGIIKESEDVWYYYVNGVKTYAGLIVIDGDYYYVDSSCMVKHDCTYWISKTNGLLREGPYYFDSEGKLLIDGAPDVPVTPPTPEDPDAPVLNGIVKESEDVWYYYVDGVKTYAGLILIDGDYYYVNSKCQVVHDCVYWVSKTNGYMSNGNYVFDAEGKLVLGEEPVIPPTPEDPDVPVLNGIVKESDDVWYYYENGVKTYAGLILIDGDYYYVDSKCTVKHDCTYWISKNNGYMENKNYVFDSEGKMVLDAEPGAPSVPGNPVDPTLNGIVKESDSVWYYYENGVKTYAGLILIDGDYYYVDSHCMVKHDCVYWISKNNGYMKNGNYVFDSEGKMVLDGEPVIPPTPDQPVDPDAPVLNGIVKESDDVWYYYENGVKTYAGLILIDGDYYYVDSQCMVKHDCTYWISKNNGYMKNGYYTFDSEGKMVLNSEPVAPPTPDQPAEPDAPVLNGIVKESEDVWYYYENGVKTYAGLIVIDGYYYYVDSSCMVKHDCTYWISKNNGYMKNGSYTFDSEGRIVDVLPE